MKHFLFSLMSVPIKTSCKQTDKAVGMEFTMKHIKVVKTKCLKTDGGCGECQSSCQSACKTSCTVGNQECAKENK